MEQDDDEEKYNVKCSLEASAKTMKKKKLHKISEQKSSCAKV